MRSHRQYENRKAKQQPDFETPHHVPKLRVVLTGSSLHRFKRHSANRTNARMILPDLRVHWTRINCGNLLRESGIALKRHPAFRTCPGFVRLRARAHGAEPFLGWFEAHLMMVMMILLRLRGRTPVTRI